MKDTIHKGILGVAGPATGWMISVSVAETWLRLASLAIGIIVGIFSAVSLFLTIRRKWRHRNDP